LGRIPSSLEQASSSALEIVTCSCISIAPSATTLIQRLCFLSSSVTHLVRCVEGFLQRLKRLEAIQVSRDEFAFASVDVRERTEAVVFQLKDIIGIVKGLRYQPEPQRVSAW